MQLLADLDAIEVALVALELAVDTSDLLPDPISLWGPVFDFFEIRF